MVTSKPQPSRRIVIFYALFAIVWIALSDTILYAMVMENLHALPWETAKGIVFVLVTSALLWWLLQREAGKQAVYFDANLRLREQVRSFLEVITDAVVIVDHEWRYIYINSRAGEILQHDPKDMIGRSMWDIFPESRDSVFYEQFHHAMREQRSVNVEGYILQWDRWFEARVFPSGRELVVFFQDVSERVQAERELRRQKQQLQILSHRLLQAQEEERRRLAHEMHDEIGQLLTVATINLRALKEGCPPDAQPRLEETRAGLETILQQVRNLTLNLRPTLLDDLGLAPALRWYAQRIQAGLEIPIETRFDDDMPRYPAEVETACFRIAQEAMTNIARHAEAGSIRLSLTFDRHTLRLTIEDDGKGFDAQAMQKSDSLQSFGLLGMRERARLAGGQLDIQSRPGNGTTLTARFPLESRVAA